MSILYVKIFYGPCHTFHTRNPKPQRLTGLKDRLQKLGFRVDLVAVQFTNYCRIEMCGHEIFRCNLKGLKFNTHPDRDPICLRAVEAVMTSAVRFRRGRAYLWFGTLLNHQLFRRNIYSPKDYWPVEVDFSAFTTCKECWECCNQELLQQGDVDEQSAIFSLKKEALPSSESATHAVDKNKSAPRNADNNPNATRVVDNNLKATRVVDNNPNATRTAVNNLNTTRTTDNDLSATCTAGNNQSVTCTTDNNFMTMQTPVP